MQQNLDRFKYKIAIIEVDNQTSIYDVFSIRWEDDGLYVKFYDYSKKGLYADYRLQEVNQNNCKFQLLQCTGLKDKNGKLIFEGDVLKVPKEYNFGNLQKVIITWQDGCFGFQSVGFSEFRTDSEIELFEVIGNIYENKELNKK